MRRTQEKTFVEQFMLQGANVKRISRKGKNAAPSASGPLCGYLRRYRATHDQLGMD